MRSVDLLAQWSGDTERMKRRVRILVGVCTAALLIPTPASQPVRAGTDGISYTVRPSVGGPRSRYTATLRNQGTRTIEHGEGFTLGVRTNDGWDRMRFGRNCGWPDIGYSMEPGGSWSERVGWLGRRCHFRALPAGRYRVNKWIRVTSDGVSPGYDKVVRGFFRVEE